MGADLPGRPSGAQLLGYSALIDAYQLECPPPRRLTAIAAVGQKTTIVREGVAPLAVLAPVVDAAEAAAEPAPAEQAAGIELDTPAIEAAVTNEAETPSEAAAADTPADPPRRGWWQRTFG